MGYWLLFLEIAFTKKIWVRVIENTRSISTTFWIAPQAAAIRKAVFLPCCGRNISYSLFSAECIKLRFPQNTKPRFPFWETGSCWAYSMAPLNLRLQVSCNVRVLSEASLWTLFSVVCCCIVRNYIDLSEFWYVLPKKRGYGKRISCFVFLFLRLTKDPNRIQTFILWDLQAGDIQNIKNKRHITDKTFHESSIRFFHKIVHRAYFYGQKSGRQWCAGQIFLARTKK